MKFLVPRLRCLVGLLVLCGPALAVGAAGDDWAPLFSCETATEGKYILILGREDGPDSPWRDIHYVFGHEDKPEMVFPSDPAKGAKLMFFSHQSLKKNYYVSIRFVTGRYQYRVYSYSGAGGAGVTVSNAKGKVLSTIRCIERPYMFPAYLQRSLACDVQNPYGKAACGKNPYQVKR